MARPNRQNREMRRLAEQLTALSVTQTQATITKHTGPLPAPETLAEYERAMPGLADRIVRMAEAEAEHRRALEKQLLDAQVQDGRAFRGIERSGQYCALAIAICTVTGGFVAICFGHTLSGSLLSGGTVISLVALFIYGRERRLAEAKTDAAPAAPEGDNTASGTELAPPTKT